MKTKFNISGCLDIEMKKIPSYLHKINILKNEIFLQITFMIHHKWRVNIGYHSACGINFNLRYDSILLHTYIYTPTLY